MYCVNGSVHGYKGHEYVYIIVCVFVCVSGRDMESQSGINQKRKYVKGCLLAKNNNVVCFCSNIISVVMPAALEESVTMTIPLFFHFKYNTE